MEKERFFVEHEGAVAEPGVAALLEGGFVEAYLASISRVPYKLTAAGRAAAAVAVPPPDAEAEPAAPPAMAIHKYFLAQIVAAKQAPWFHDVEMEAMLDEGLLEPDVASTKRHAPLRLTAKGAEALKAA